MSITLPQPPTPSIDPLPWFTDRLKRAGALTDGPLTGESMAAMLDALTDTVAALQDDETPYRVVLDPGVATAATDAHAHVVVVGTKPLNEADLTDGQRAAIMVGQTLHEVGHIRADVRGYEQAVRGLFSGRVTGAIMALSNLAADLHDEAAVARAFPGAAASLPPTMWWVSGKGQGTPRRASEGLKQSSQARTNLAIAATRFPWQVIWDGQEGEEWFHWWQDWAQRAGQAGEAQAHALIVREGIEKVRDWAPEPEPEPEPEEGKGEPQEQPQGEGDPEPSNGGDRSDDEPEPGDEPEGEGEDGDEQQQGSGPAPEGSDKPEPGEGEGEGQGTEADPDADAPTADGESAQQPPEGPSSEQGGGNAAAERDEDPTEGFVSTCPNDKAHDAALDRILQTQVEMVHKGKREGNYARTYHHEGASRYQVRKVARIPFRNGHWVVNEGAMASPDEPERRR